MICPRQPESPSSEVPRQLPMSLNLDRLALRMYLCLHYGVNP